MADLLRQIIVANRAGRTVAIPSVCSAHPDVLLASLRLAAELNRPIVIEATSNQVNQDGGYTGLRPADFIMQVRCMAQVAGCNAAQMIFGGDHIGPQVWRKGDADTAMAQARIMVADYVRAGFTKIHLDCSEGCAGEPPQVGDTIAATRAADLAKAALAATDTPAFLMFIVGTEVPPPGGARADDHGAITPTTAAAALATMAAHKAAFDAAGLGHAIDHFCNAPRSTHVMAIHKHGEALDNCRYQVPSHLGLKRSGQRVPGRSLLDISSTGGSVVMWTPHLCLHPSI